MELTPPASCSKALVALVVAERQAGRHAAFFTAIEAEWRDRVEHYIDHGGSPQHVPDWPAVEVRRGTLHNLYSKAPAGTAHGDALGPIRDHDLDLCPACGEPGAPNTLDHYLPKGKYPHFAITPANLFPMCDACQGKKLEKTGDAVTPRFFIHPYFDRFSVPQVVRLSIDPPFDAPAFALSPAPELQPAEATLVGTHLRELDVHARYVRFFRNEHRRIVRNVARLRASGVDIDATLEAFRAGAAHPTVNSWQHVFYSGVLGNADLLDYLRTRDLPAYP